jgi:hypothetical protein
LLETKKVVQYFFGKINLIIRFTSNFAEITKPISNLLKDDQEFKWDDHSRATFKIIKNDISMEHVLLSPYYSKDFQVFSFSLEETITSVLLSKNDNNQEQTIEFMSWALRDS